MSDELKPCPFCGGEATLGRMGTGRASMQIYCTDCGASVETSETWIDKNSRWNTRTDQTTEMQAAIVELRGALKAISFSAQTSGGTAGSDDHLMQTIDVAGQALSNTEKWV